MSVITLPWMPSQLSPNSRVHWAQKSRVAKKYRGECRDIAYLAGWKRLDCVRNWMPFKKLILTIEFYKPSRRGDDDNLEAMFKSGRDGLSDAIGIDDKHFIAVRKVMPDPVKGGMVMVKIEAQNANI